MRKFDFRLGRLLGIRAWHEREWELKLAKAQMMVIELQGALHHNRTEQQHNNACADGRGLLAQEELQARTLYVRRLRQEEERCITSLNQALAHEEKVKAEYLEKRKARMVLEKLKERRATEYYAEQLSAEGAMLDDFALARDVRNRVKGGEDL